MEYRRLFILVEGDDDERFHDRIVRPLLEKSYESVQILKHASWSNKYLNDYIKSIRDMKGKYIYLKDINDEPCVTSKKQQIRRRFQGIDIDRIAIVVKEIESWYLAGLDKKNFEQLGIRKSYPRTTDTIIKEQFNAYMPRRFDSRIDFMLEILKSYSIEIAKDRNISFSYIKENFC